MTAIKQSQSAQIIPFPLARLRNTANGVKTASPSPIQPPATGVAVAAAGGSGWYHDAAMHDGDPTRR